MKYPYFVKKLGIDILLRVADLLELSATRTQLTERYEYTRN